MGNVLSTAFDSVEYLYEKYYTKSKWLQPRYVSSALMVSSVAYSLSLKKVSDNATNFTTNFTFLFSTGATLGLQLWVLFINGLTMMRLLPRHQFGVVQSNLFPKFFFLTTLFNFGSLSVFLKSNPLPWSGDMLPLGACLASSFFLNVVNFTCFNPCAIKYNLKMHQIERNAGEGLTTIGKLMQNTQCENDPEYLKSKKKFNRFHGFCSLGALLSFGATIGEYYLLSHKSFF